jgi:hypothetical protein
MTDHSNISNRIACPGMNGLVTEMNVLVTGMNVLVTGMNELLTRRNKLLTCSESQPDLTWPK